MDFIYNISQNYIKSIKNDKINSDYRELIDFNKNKKDNLEKLFKKYISTDKDLLNKYTLYQIGGTKEDEYVEKLEELDQIISQFTTLNPEELEQKKQELTTKITDLETKLLGLKQQIDSKKTNLKDIVTSSRLPQYLKTIDTQISDMTNGLEINVDMKTTDIPIIQNIEGIVTYKTFESLREDFMNEQERLIKLTEDKKQIEIDKLVESINKSIDKIKESNNKIDEVNKELEKRLEEFRKTLEVGEIKKTDFEVISVKDDKYNGRDTIRITNNIFSDITTQDKLTMINNLLTIRDSDVAVQLRSLDEMYSPNISVQPIAQSGGNLEDAITRFTNEIVKYKSVYNEYSKKLNSYNISIVKNVLHSIYLMTILQNKLFVTNYVIYKYIGRGTIRFYKRIIDRIYDEIQKGNMSNPIIIEMRKKYFVTIYVLRDFLDKLSKILNSDDRIDINQTKNEDYRQYFLLLNHFKDILDKYNLRFQNKITIYGRINDRYNDRYKDRQTNNDFIDKKKIFISDIERKQIYEQEQIIDEEIEFIKEINKRKNDDLEEKKKEITESKMSLDKKKELQEGLVKKEKNINKYTDIDISRLKNKDIDERLLWVRSKNSCNSIKYPTLTSYKFTEVFDSTEFTNNADISKYMALETRLGTGNSTCVITYGYSGTGKSYTLFGRNKANEPKIAGLLQSTLDNLNGLSELYFRIFEIYGRGTTYTDYWRNENNIDNYLYAYRLKTEEQKFVIDNVQEFKGQTMNDYIKYVDESDDNKVKLGYYINVKGSDKISSLFLNFSDFVDDIDIKRVNGEGSTNNQPRIRETPNNPQSSRSIIIYDFILRLGDGKNIYFVIIDLPGREEIAPTFVNGYMNNEHIKKAIIDNYNDLTEDEKRITINSDNYISELRIMLLSITINPILMGIFATEEIKNFCLINAEELNDFINTHNIYKIQYTKKALKGSSGGRQQDYIIKRKLTNGDMIDFKTNEIGSLFENLDLKNLTINKMDKKYENNDPYITIIYGLNMLANNGKQAYAILFMYLIRQLCLEGRFDILNNMNKYILDIKLNNLLDKYINQETNIKSFIEKLRDSNFKSLIMKDILDKNTDKTDDELKTLLKKKIKYDFYTTGFEGIYINENIMGLIKYLAQTGLKDANGNVYSEDDIKNKLNIIDQNEKKLNIDRQLAIARILLHSNQTEQIDNDPDNPDNCETATQPQESQSQGLPEWKKQFEERRQKQEAAKKINKLSRIETSKEYSDDSKNIKIECMDIPKQLFYVDNKPQDQATPEEINNQNYKYYKNNLDNNFDLINSEYKSDKMYMFNNPLIAQILNPYLGPNKIETFLVFYLFGNDDDELRKLKCDNQFLLLESTRSFIEAINPE